MSEEEVKLINEIIYNCLNKNLYKDEKAEKKAGALTNILILTARYEKELEELKEINKEHQLLNGELAFKLGKLEEENKELRVIESLYKILLKGMEDIQDKNFISKSKIEDKIKKLEEDFEEADEKMQIEFEEIQENIINILKDLLEEE